MRYTAEPHALVVSADAVTRALESLEAVRLDQDLGALGPAVTGGATAARITAIITQWDVRLADARARLRTHGSALVVAAQGYDEVETGAAQWLRATGPGRS
ncbi:hypothetical protein [Intrasporangium sp.]|uniref:hypothetical protein n=1 Tax=Intrasporangium sp. TaxID=1925024 RepID=UPI00322220B4